MAIRGTVCSKKIAATITRAAYQSPPGVTSRVLNVLLKPEVMMGVVSGSFSEARWRYRRERSTFDVTLSDGDAATDAEGFGGDP